MSVEIQYQDTSDPPAAKVMDADGNVVHRRQCAPMARVGVMPTATKLDKGP